MPEDREVDAAVNPDVQTAEEVKETLADEGMCAVHGVLAFRWPVGSYSVIAVLYYR